MFQSTALEVTLIAIANTNINNLLYIYFSLLVCTAATVFDEHDLKFAITLDVKEGTRNW